MLRAILAAGVLAAAAAPAHAQEDQEVGDRDDRAKAAERADDADPDPAAAATPTPAQPVAPIALRWQPALEGKVRAGAGAVSGDTINAGTAAMSLVEGTLTPRLTRGRYTLDAPIDFGHRQTLGGARLSESRVLGILRGTVRFTPRIRLSGELGLGATWRPDWPDPFQPLAGDDVGATDRYSHWDRRAGADLVLRPARRQRVRISYDYLLGVYKQDPMFDPIYDPLHLTPWDRDTHRLDAVWRIRRDRVKLRVGAEAALRRYFYIFSGDADTGVTHAGAGGEPPNPLLELRWLKPRLEAELEVTPAILVGARYELELVQDTYQGYLSYAGHHPRLEASWALPRDAELRARVELWLRRYGANSYDGMDLSSGGDGRRSDTLADFGLAFARPFAPHWSAIADARLSVRRSSYASSITVDETGAVLEVGWSYLNWIGWAGVEYRY
jgi:hypothetical protein